MDLTFSPWRKASDSDAGSNCVEVSEGHSGSVVRVVRVRDSKDRTGPSLSFTPDRWRDFIGSAKNGEFV